MIGITLENGVLDMDLEYQDGLKSSILLSILSEKNSSWIAGAMKLGNEFGFKKAENLGRMKRRFLESLDWMIEQGLAEEVDVEIEMKDESMTIYVNHSVSEGEKKRISFYFEDGKIKGGI